MWWAYAHRISTVSYIHWRGVPQGPGRGRRPRPGPLRYIPTVNVGKLFSHAPRMAQITAAARSWLQWSIVVLSREPCERRGENPFSDISRLGGKYRVWIFPLRDSRGSTGKSTLDSDHLFVCKSSRDMGERILPRVFLFMDRAKTRILTTWCLAPFFSVHNADSKGTPVAVLSKV